MRIFDKAKRWLLKLMEDIDDAQCEAAGPATYDWGPHHHAGRPHGEGPEYVSFIDIRHADLEESPVDVMALIRKQWGEAADEAFMRQARECGADDLEAERTEIVGRLADRDLTEDEVERIDQIDRKRWRAPGGCED